VQEEKRLKFFKTEVFLTNFDIDTIRRIIKKRIKLNSICDTQILCKFVYQEILKRGKDLLTFFNAIFDEISNLYFLDSRLLLHGLICLNIHKLTKLEISSLFASLSIKGDLNKLDIIKIGLISENIQINYNDLNMDEVLLQLYILIKHKVKFGKHNTKIVGTHNNLQEVISVNDFYTLISSSCRKNIEKLQSTIDLLRINCEGISNSFLSILKIRLALKSIAKNELLLKKCKKLYDYCSEFY